MLSVDEALARLLASAPPATQIEVVAIADAAGRVLAQTQVAAEDSPPLDNSAMDGYAVATADVPEPGTWLPVSQRIPAGTVGTTLRPRTAARIFTGAPIPSGADAVVIQELCEHAPDAVRIDHRPSPGEHIRRAGSDIMAGSAILAVGQRLRPQDVALAASVGIARLPVYRRLRVAVAFTGDELTMPGDALRPGAIYNSNRFLLCSLLDRLGCVVSDFGQVPDDLSELRRVFCAAAAESDLLLCSGGVSVGEEDHVKAALESEGRVDIWKIAVKPGKPLISGWIGGDRRQVPLIGLPGNPVSSLVGFLVFVRPVVLKMQGAQWITPPAYALRADFDWLQPDARREFLRVRRNPEGGLDLFPNQGSGVLTSAVWGDGLVDNPPRRVVHRGDVVDFLPFAELLS
ncbi:gephyrin-like molybdotransferase Glp [Accumulibacter sp.]|uniref:molybdopterin molybdotransferase MoeA n=1 Tax=Accumulibacter sp. TaxID=2053492 RepID=UPI0025CF3368|nr:gephyrin-like molybdotransferase Glp [Accumulibacter sp.]MCM8596430.1 molybdopterin molybdotransferase MoeA [Accumulibacter sp.]MDS4050579.1 molybdopterin molybdotransferase MoeA [Accumulibacter sp.]